MGFPFRRTKRGSSAAISAPGAAPAAPVAEEERLSADAPSPSAPRRARTAPLRAPPHTPRRFALRV
jgi:hypothetical protein